MNIKIVAVILLVMLVTAAGTVAAAQYSSTRQSGLSMVRTYSSDDSDAGRIVLYTVKPVTNLQIHRGNAVIARTGIINPRLPVYAKRTVYTGWRPKINIYRKPAIPTGEELETDNPVTTDNEQLDSVVVKGPYYDPGAPEYEPGEFIVKFKPDVREDAINEINARYGVSVKETLPTLCEPPGSKLLSVPEGKTVEEMVRIYERLPEVKYAQPNGIGHIQTGKISILDE